MGLLLTKNPNGFPFKKATCFDHKREIFSKCILRMDLKMAHKNKQK
jgi:hypothetical protein